MINSNYRKTKILKIKEVIFANYYGQKIAMFPKDRRKFLSQEVNTNIDCYLTVKSLSKISEKDTIEVAKIFGYNDKMTKDELLKYGKIELSKLLCGNQKKFSRINWCIQYLKSKGYAFDFMNYTVKDLIELGIFKLI